MTLGVIVEAKAHSQDARTCHGYRRRSASNDILLGESGQLYVVVNLGLNRCMNVVISSPS